MNRSSWILAGGAALVLIVGAWFALYPGKRLPADPLQSVPGDALGILRLRIDRVLASETVRRVLSERGQLRGVERVERACGFHPLHGLREVVLFARPAAPGKRPKIALMARGDIAHAKLVSCVGKLGRSGFDDVIHETIEGIDTLRSKNGRARAAFVGADGLLAGDGESVKAAIEAMVEKAPSAREDALLAPLYRKLDVHSDVALVARARGNEVALSQALSDLGLAQQLSVKDLVAFSASATLNESVSGCAAIVTSNPAAAQRLVARGEELRARILGFPLLALTGFAPPLRELRLRREDTRATISGQIPLNMLAAAFDAIPAFVALQRQLMPAGDVGRDAGAATRAP